MVGRDDSQRRDLIVRSLATDLAAVARGEMSLVLIDGEGRMLDAALATCGGAAERALSNALRVFAPPAADLPLATNLFDLIGGSDDPLERERRLNAAADLCNYVLEPVFGSEIVRGQSQELRHCYRLMQLIPGATLASLLRLLQDPDAPEHVLHIASLEQGPARRFLTSGITASGFEPVRTAMRRGLERLLAGADVPAALARASTSPQISTILEEARVVHFASTAQALGRSGMLVGARLALATIAHVVRSRTRKQSGRLPVRVVIEGCPHLLRGTELDLEALLGKALGAKVAFTVANRSLSELSAGARTALLQPGLLRAAVGLDGTDADVLAPVLRADAALLRLPSGSAPAPVAISWDGQPALLLAQLAEVDTAEVPGADVVKRAAQTR